MTYAADTNVSVERSRAELEKTLDRYGASAFGYFTETGRAVIMFAAHDRRLRFILPLPARPDRGLTHTPSRNVLRTPQQALEAWEQACRQKWRALNLAVKAKLESVEAGIAEFEDEFLAYTVMPTGRTVAEELQPKIDEAYRQGYVPEGFFESLQRPSNGAREIEA